LLRGPPSLSLALMTSVVWLQKTVKLSDTKILTEFNLKKILKQAPTWTPETQTWQVIVLQLDSF
jgi:hypothetical protein